MKIIKAEVKECTQTSYDFVAAVTVVCDGVTRVGIAHRDCPTMALQHAFDAAVGFFTHPLRDALKVTVSAGF